MGNNDSESRRIWFGSKKCNKTKFIEIMINKYPDLKTLDSDILIKLLFPYKISQWLKN